MPNVEVADVSDPLPPTIFQYLKGEVGRHRMRFFDGHVKYVVHRYEEDQESVSKNEDQEKVAKKKAGLVNEVFACCFSTPYTRSRRSTNN